MRIFEALRIREDSKRLLKTSNMVKPWPEPRPKTVKEEAAKEQVRTTRTKGPTVYPWWGPRSMVVPTNLPWSALFPRAC